MSNDPFSAIAEPAQQSDPFASIAEKPSSNQSDDIYIAPSDSSGGIGRFLSAAAAPIKGAIKGFDPRPTKDERSRGLTSAYDYALRPLERAVQGQIDQGEQAFDPSLSTPERLGHGLAAVTPLVGPWAASVGETLGKQAGAGDYAGAAGTVAGNAAVAFGPKVAKETLRAVPKVARAVAGAGPKSVGDLVKETQKENVEIGESNKKLGEEHLEATQNALHETEGRELQHKQAVKAAQDESTEKQQKQDAEHAKDVADAEAKRKLDLRKHFEKTQAAEEKNTQAEAGPARKAALGRGVEHLDTEIRTDLEKTRDNVNAEANRQYTVLSKALGNKPAPMYEPVDEEGHISGEPQTITSRLYEVAKKPLRGTDTEPTIIKSLERRVQQGETTLNYNDLQGYREEIGRELRKGTLPPDVFTAYKNLMPEIDNAMQKIADRNGLGPAQTAA